MTEFELAVMEKLASIAEVSATTEQKVTGLETRLFNGGSGVIYTLQQDIQEIKEDRRRDERWEKIHNVLHYSLPPFLIALHSALRQLGLNI